MSVVALVVSTSQWSDAPRDDSQLPEIELAIDATNANNPLAIDTLAGNGAYGTVDGIGEDAGFTTMGGVAIEGGSAYVGTYGSIREVDLTTREASILAGHSTAIDCNDSADPSEVRFKQITDIESDGTYLYTASACGIGASSYLVRKTAIDTGATTTLASVLFGRLSHAGT